MTWIGLARIARRFGVALLLLTIASGASAACMRGGDGSAFLLSLPATVSVARDLAPGSLLTNWVQSPQSTDLWECNGGTGNGGVRSIVGDSFNTNSGQTYNGLTVWNTNVPGVGLVVQARYYFTPSAPCAYPGGWSSPWVSIRNIWYGQVCATPATPMTGPSGSQISVALVKTGTVAQTGVISGTVGRAAPVEGQAAGTALESLAVTYDISAVTIVPMTCTTPDVHVRMGTPLVADVDQARNNNVPFNIEFNDCPAGAIVTGTASGMISTVKYQIVPTNGTAATDIAKLDNVQSSAGGVGVQLLTAGGTVYPLSTSPWRDLSQFNGSVGGSYVVPMMARYAKTGTVTPGKANATMTMYVLYQ
ncbi:Fimbrial protein [Caballeronia calidae]|uniref:Fimbrial protein n=2 Tax=Caballeronia calidae TaxID=1777139 RepID=A0A158E2W3_9BURK|nr:Fimbrial protein [Caballeronia calidae]